MTDKMRDALEQISQLIAHARALAGPVDLPRWQRIADAALSQAGEVSRSQTAVHIIVGGDLLCSDGSILDHQWVEPDMASAATCDACLKAHAASVEDGAKVMAAIDVVAILTPRIEELEQQISFALGFMPPAPISISTAEARVLVNALKQRRDDALPAPPA